jgi:CMP-N,N'-diacetyllegionaminic acid synthase
MKTLALIPARGGSKRLPGKNVREFLGKPLIHWSIAFARQSQMFERVVVSTDSEEIARSCNIAGLEVPFLRPLELATDTASTVDVAAEILLHEERLGRSYDLVALLQPTSPLREVSRWQAAFQLMDQKSCDAVVGTSPVRDHPLHVFKRLSDGSLMPWSDSTGLKLRTQDLPPALRVNGSLYLIRTSVLREERTFYPQRTLGVVCGEPWEDLDIDTEADWVVGEALAKHFGRHA